MPAYLTIWKLISFYLHSKAVFVNTNDHLVRLQTEINGAFGKGHKTIAVFVDIEKAYDMVWKHGLLEKIYKLGIRGPMFNFIETFITEIYFRVNVGGSFSPVTNLENGIPQGSVIAPTLFSIYINDLATVMTGNQKYKSTKFSIGLFADDAAFWRTGIHIGHLKRLFKLTSIIYKIGQKTGVSNFPNLKQFL